MSELDELRIKIAEKYGWTRITEDPYGEGLYGMLEGVKPSFIPKWTTDISDAWELIEEMQTTGRNGVYQILGNRWNCTAFKIFKYPGDNQEYSELIAEGQGDTAPEAISRAWLAWKEAQA